MNLNDPPTYEVVLYKLDHLITISRNNPPYTERLIYNSVPNVLRLNNK